jgi:tellurite methyltransferase
MTSSIDWAEFIERAPQRAHRTTQRAAELIAPVRGAALDIGTGNGRDALFLAESGFDVTAVDISAAAKTMTHPCVRYVLADIVTFPLQTYVLINASLVLPFIARETFPAVWRRLVDSLSPGGVVAGHLSGTRDWKVLAGHAWGCDLLDVRELLVGVDVLSVDENEFDGPNNSGVVVHKHNFGFIAQKG